tara:strand:- start:1326 stop:1490 length:165 start_codon:yes stop_codon:yes gene_type:complete
LAAFSAAAISSGVFTGMGISSSGYTIEYFSRSSLGFNAIYRVSSDGILVSSMKP